MEIKTSKKTVRGRLHLRISSLTQEKLIPMISQSALKAAQIEIKGLTTRSFQSIESICVKHNAAPANPSPMESASHEKR